MTSVHPLPQGHKHPWFFSWSEASSSLVFPGRQASGWKALINGTLIMPFTIWTCVRKGSESVLVKGALSCRAALTLRFCCVMHFEWARQLYGVCPPRYVARPIGEDLILCCARLHQVDKRWSSHASHYYCCSLLTLQVTNPCKGSLPPKRRNQYNAFNRKQ